MYLFKNESNYPFHKFQENPPILTKLGWSYFILFFSLSFILYIYSFQISPVVTGDPVL